MLSIHGLIRSENLQLGRDADTGGQVLYVVELLKALGKHPKVDRVDLLTRQIIDKNIDDCYAELVEPVNDSANIIRIPCGPRRYLRKESLWPHMDMFADNAIKHIEYVGERPDLIHGHYADAGYVGSKIARNIEVPFFFTGHSLGREKKARLMDRGSTLESLERNYNISTRIEAEEKALDVADRVITSTQQEIEEQYSNYDNYRPESMLVLPPGIDLENFHPSDIDEITYPYKQEIDRFLVEPEKPLVLTLGRPDERKNLLGLLEAYGENEELRELANLAILAGSREDISEMKRSLRVVLKKMLIMIDKYDLYGKVAYPKKNESEDIPWVYRIAKRRKGVAVSPSYQEGFGLTLVEASATGLPIVATKNGGPRDIINNCQNGYLIDPTDPDDISSKILKILQDEEKWDQFSKQGIQGVKEHYTWEGHVNKYIDEIKQINREMQKSNMDIFSKKKNFKSDRILITDIDNTLIGDRQAFENYLNYINEKSGDFLFGLASGRTLESMQKAIQEWGIPHPDIMICSVGTEIYYNPDLVQDQDWRHHIDYKWQPEKILRLIENLEGIEKQPDENQREFKLSFYYDPERAPTGQELLTILRKNDIAARLIESHSGLLDILPIRASKGDAIRHIYMERDIEPEKILVCGDSGNDEDMLRGNTLGLVVSNYSKELEKLKGEPRIYFANNQYAEGIIEGIEHYNFLDNIIIPGE